MNDFINHIRLNESILRNLEKKALDWLAPRMPAWVTPDKLTGIGFVGAVLIFIGFRMTVYHEAYLWLASFGFLVNWFGDSLDGTLARYRKIERPRYGFFIDHAIDAFEAVLIFVGYGLSRYVSLNIASMTLVGYLLLALLSSLLLNVYGVFRITYANIGPTEFRALAIIFNTIVFFIGNPELNLPFGTITFYNLVMIIVAILLFVFYIILVIKEGRNLARIEKLPPSQD